MRRPFGCLFPFLVPVVFVGGCIGGGMAGMARQGRTPGPAIYARLPHHVPPAPDAAAFRFAMVHDVVHERYPQHGPEYYQERERLARERMPGFHPDSETVYALTDDIAVGLARQGRRDKAIALMRDKLKRQQAIGLTGKDLYSTYANLAEFLIHGHVRAMLGGDPDARRHVEEGREFLRRSIEVNPKAHFGREAWQVVAVDAWLDAGARPLFLREIDLIGNQLDVTIEVPREQWLRGLEFQGQATYGRPFAFEWTHSLHSSERQPDVDRNNADPEWRAKHRRYIARVGGEDRPKNPGENRGKRAPFDEPALWLIGEWRQGAGPNPHFALCLGEIMLRVGQRYLAWDCYERASRLADQFSPAAEDQQFLRDHCKARQTAIEQSLSAEEVAGLRPRFESELAFGEAYQRDYQAYEEEQIRAGSNLNDPHFYDEFHAGRPPIASRVGPEEWYAGHRNSYSIPLRAFWEWGLLSGGLCVLLVALFLRWHYRPR